jgi:all-trans-retinol 13,14-reductase
MYSPANSKSGNFANGLIIMTYMRFEELRQWQHTNRSNRPQEYYDFKEQKSEKLLSALEKRFPCIRNHVTSYYSSTPLSYRDYTGTPDGSAYGILKKADNPLLTIVSPKSKISNLLFTGQNINMHGILGVTISSMLACQELIGKEYLINEIRKY